MTEYIPRDTPIYCFFSPESERDVARVQQTRDNWQQRWGYTNFILQRRVDTLGGLRRMMEPSYFEGLNKELTKPGMETHWPHEAHILNYCVNFLYLLRKLRSRPGPSIIIQSNTLLRNDIELENYDNDLTFFAFLGAWLTTDTVQNKTFRAMMQENKVHYTSGLMISQEWAKAAYSHQVKLFNNPYFSTQVSTLQEMSKRIVISPSFFRQMLPGCKHNTEDLRWKSQEEYYGFTVPN